MLDIIITTGLLAGSIAILAVKSRVNPFDLMVKHDKGFSDYSKKWINNDDDKNYQWIGGFPSGNSISVINDGYGGKNGPYEYWITRNGIKDPDVVGWNTIDDIRHTVLELY